VIRHVEVGERRRKIAGRIRECHKGSRESVLDGMVRMWELG
jgi:hypothetical protein